ncbi:hypothetical protein [Legionella quateirensis]|uniref:Uncharacterized protein n=1 Tax=Legionella quateirensis TaxID=45072 RepID=A0A378KTL3_9GAMM|nr:hypothetical protein [Legionella quateirensis]KTD54771.1 hypothetical protein Lqua_0278 [Legionella quateirensis]STY16951.1 Uncharacterised protein [Legionella quateirensis]
MQTPFFLNTNISPIIKPVNEILALNVKTLQRLTYITPVDFLSVRKPEDVLHKNMNAFIKNTQTALDYVQDMFHIFEENLFNKNGDVFVKPSQAVSSPVVRSEPSRTAKKSKSSVRTGVSKSSGSAKTSTIKAKSAVKKTASPVHLSKANVSGSSNVHPVNKTGVMKQVAKKPASTLKEAAKSTVKKPELSNVSSSITNPLIKLSPDSKKDTLK